MDNPAAGFNELDGGTGVMVAVASPELSKELYGLSRWSDPDAPSVYTLGYLLRKLPDTTKIGVSGDLYTAYSNPGGTPKNGAKWHDFVEVAESPEDAACKVAIALIKAGEIEGFKPTVPDTVR